jgi:hypothetical protein
MRIQTFWRLAAILLVLIGGAVIPAPGDTALAAVVAKDDDEGDDNDKNEGKDNGKQKDEDDDQDDEGNQGKDKEKKDNNGKAKGKDKDKGKKENVAATADYRVDVACSPGEDGTQTECAFTGIAPPDAKKVGQVDMPAEIACAEVIGGDFKVVDPDPHTHVTGFTSKGNQGMFTLVLEGTVTTGGTTTYWIKAGPDVFPAAGPGLICDAPAASESVQTTPEPTATPVPTTGDVLVVAYTCTDVPADTTGFDWFGACQPGGEVQQFMLAPTDAPDDQQPLESNGEGEAAAGELAPGTYRLDPIDDPWCHANSDNVTPEGDVTVEAGQRTTVWTFHCTGAEPLK